ncbi:MAG: hypothetical protein ACI31S_01330 [Bacilli bacterium]
MKEKKIYKIGDKIKIDELELVSKIIVKKALKVIETSGNKFATNIIEGRNNEMLEDLQQTVVLQLIIDDYIITKNCYKIVNAELYKCKKDKLLNIEIVVNDEDASCTELDKKSYIDFCNITEPKKHEKINLNDLKLTEKQMEVINIYSKLNSERAVASALGVTQQAIHKTLKAVRNKAINEYNKIY